MKAITMTSINNDHMASRALLGLNLSSKVMSQAMERLSSGQRINSSSDDASGMGISTIHKAHTKGINMSVRHAADGLGIVNSIDGALDLATNSLLKMRELAVQSSSDVYSFLDRTFMQDELNQLNLEINRLSKNTKFNNMNLLDGTFNKNISIGKTSSEVINLNISSSSSSEIGAYQIKSNSEVSSSASSLLLAKTELNRLFSSLADYSINEAGTSSLSKIDLKGGDNARDVALSFNRINSKTNIEASAITRARITISSPSNISFSMEGKGSTPSIVSASITSHNDLTSLMESINYNSSVSGIVATLTEDKTGVNLVQSEGYDILIADIEGSNITLSALDSDGNESGSSTNLVVGGNDSAGVVGNIILSSHEAFSITSGNSNNHFSADTLSQSSNLNTVGDINIKTQIGAQNALAIIDASLTFIGSIRSKMGAQTGRFEAIVNNLTSISLNTEKANNNFTDAEFGSETTKLTKFQILHQASNSMMAQANKAKNYLLKLINN